MSPVLDTLAGGVCFGLFLYKWVIIAAVVLTWVSADPYNPIVRFIARSTRPLWVWCETWMPVGLAHLSAYASLLVVIFAQALIPATLRSLGQLFSGGSGADFLWQLGGHGLQSTAVVCQSLFVFAMLILFVWFFLTLVSPALNNPVVRVVHVLADPLITPLQHYLPRTRIDFAPIVGLVLFFLMNRFLVSPLSLYGFEQSLPIRLCLY